jgi:hypothetical protein
MDMPRHFDVVFDVLDLNLSIVREHLEDTLRICDVSAMGLYWLRINRVLTIPEQYVQVKRLRFDSLRLVVSIEITANLTTKCLRSKFYLYFTGSWISIVLILFTHKNIYKLNVNGLVTSGNPVGLLWQQFMTTNSQSSKKSITKNNTLWSSECMG